MNTFLILVWLLSSICVLVGIIKVFIAKFIKKENLKEAKKWLLSSFIISFVSLIGAGLTTPLEINDTHSGDVIINVDSGDIISGIDSGNSLIDNINSGDTSEIDISSGEQENLFENSDETIIQNSTDAKEEEVIQNLTGKQDEGVVQNNPVETNKPEKDLSEIRKEALANIPNYSNKAYVIVNNNVPFFTTNDLTTKSYEKYSNLDKLGRCGTAIACVGKDIMPTEERGNIGSVKPTGWHSVRYQGVDGLYLYNRCHLIGYQLTAENANPQNLITGTRYMNVEGMLPFENMIADYVKEMGNHVLYRVTPIFKDNNLLASGVLMEGKSVEDNGKGIEFNVYCYNVQPGIKIDYTNGDNSGPGYIGGDMTLNNNSANKPNTNTSTQNSNNSQNNYNNVDDNNSITEIYPNVGNTNNNSDKEVEYTYMLNTNTKKFHETDCRSVKQMSEKNKKLYIGTRSKVISMGYDPCGNCKP